MAEPQDAVALARKYRLTVTPEGKLASPDTIPPEDLNILKRNRPYIEATLKLVPKLPEIYAERGGMARDVGAGAATGALDVWGKALETFAPERAAALRPKIEAAYEAAGPLAGVGRTAGNIAFDPFTYVAPGGGMAARLGRAALAGGGSTFLRTGSPLAAFGGGAATAVLDSLLRVPGAVSRATRPSATQAARIAELQALGQQHGVRIMPGDVRPRVAGLEDLLANVPGSPVKAAMEQRVASLPQAAKNLSAGYEQGFSRLSPGATPQDVLAANVKRVEAGITKKADAWARKFGPGLSDDEAGQIVRKSLADRYEAKRVVADDLYQKAEQLYEAASTPAPGAMSPIQGAARQAFQGLDLAGLKGDAGKLLAHQQRLLPSSQRPDLVRVLEDVRGAPPMSFLQLHGNRSVWLDEARKLATAGDNAGAALYNQLAASAEKTFEDFGAALAKTNPEAYQTYRAAQDYWKKEIVPFKEKAVADAMNGRIDAEDIPRVFAGRGKTTPQTEILPLLDERGQGALRAWAAGQTVRAATERVAGGRVVEPGKFAGELQGMIEGQGPLFRKGEPMRAGALAEQMRREAETAIRPADVEKLVSRNFPAGALTPQANMYRRLDPAGKAAVKTELVSEALRKSMSEEAGRAFGAEKFASELESLATRQGVTFTDAEKLEMTGLAKLLRAVGPRSQQMASATRIQTGGKLQAPAAAGVLLGAGGAGGYAKGGTVGALTGAAAAYGTALGAGKLLLSKPAQKWLTTLATAPENSAPWKRALTNLIFVQGPRQIGARGVQSTREARP